MRKVLITGAAGFIGSNLVNRLLKDGDFVIGVDNFDAFYNPALKRQNLDWATENTLNFKLFEGDIRDKLFLTECFKISQPDFVIHLAARAGVRPSIDNPELYYDVNVMGTLCLLEVMREQGINKLIFASSSSVYGNNAKYPFSETDFVDNPVSPYAATKKAGELLCYSYHHLYNFDIFCLRFFTVYGHNQRPEMAIQKFGRLIKEGKPVAMFGNGTTRRDYTFIEDIIDGIVASVEKLKGFEVINLGNNQTVMLRDLINHISHQVGKEAIIDQKPNQPGDVELTYADISKAKKMLDYEPKYNIKEGLHKMFTLKTK